MLLSFNYRKDDSNMNKKEEKPLKILMKWAQGDRYYVYISVVCSAISGISTIIPYLCIYNVIDIILKGNIYSTDILKNAAVIAVSILVRDSFRSLSTVMSHKGAYKTLFRVR